MSTTFYTAVIKRKSKTSEKISYQAQIRPRDTISGKKATSKSFATRQAAHDFIAAFLQDQSEEKQSRRLKVNKKDGSSTVIMASNISVAGALFIYAREIVCMQKNRKDMYHRINRFLRAAGMQEIEPLSPIGELHLKKAVKFKKTRNGQRTSTAMRKARTENSLVVDEHIADIAVMPFSNLGAHDIERFKRCGKAASKPLAPSTINHFINLFRKLVKTARKEWHWDEINLDVYHNSTLLRVPKKEKSVVHPEHFIALINYAQTKSENKNLLPFILLSAMLGTRFSELAHKLSWEQVDWQAGVMYLNPDLSKANMHERLVITEEVKAVLWSLPSYSTRCGSLFTTTYESIRACLRRAWDALKLPRYTLHQFRHTAITDEAHYNGGDVGKTQLFSRHNSVSMAMHYTHTDFEEHAQERRYRFSSEPAPKPKYPRVQEIARNAALGYPLDFQFTPDCPTPDCAASKKTSDEKGRSKIVQLRIAR